MSQQKLRVLNNAFRTVVTIEHTTGLQELIRYGLTNKKQRIGQGSKIVVNQFQEIKMLSCICGGIMEIIMAICVLVGGGFCAWITNLVNRHNAKHHHCKKHKETENQVVRITVHKE